MQHTFRKVFLCIAFALCAALPGRAQLHTNLIVNGDAEMGGPAPTDDVIVPVPGWWTGGTTLTVHGYGSPELSYSSMGPANRGHNFFYGGPGSVTSFAGQLIDVSWAGGLIDAGEAPFELSGWLGGYQRQNDRALLSAYFYDTGGNQLGFGRIGPVTRFDRGDVSGLVYRSTSGRVPFSTRFVWVSLDTIRQGGFDNDGYADNLSFALVPEPGVWSFLLAGGAAGAFFLRLRRRR